LAILRDELIEGGTDPNPKRIGAHRFGRTILIHFEEDIQKRHHRKKREKRENRVQNIEQKIGQQLRFVVGD
jgi:hypothetical protein